MGVGQVGEDVQPVEDIEIYFNYSQPPAWYPSTPPPIPQVPELSTWAMLGIGFAILFGLRRKHASQNFVS